MPSRPRREGSAPNGVRAFFADRANLLLTVAPTALAGITTGFLAWAQLDGGLATALRWVAIAAGAAATALLLVKAVREYRRAQSLVEARYDTMKELRNNLGPALDLMAELAEVDPVATEPTVLHQTRQQTLKTIATHCCSALVAMTPASAEVRAIVFEFRQPDQLYPLARFGRSDVPRTFHFDSPDGAEVLGYLSGPSPQGELFTDTDKVAPAGYDGDRARYRTFIRVPIWSNGTIYGMVAVDAPKAGSLSQGDVLVAELIAAELAPAFAIAAP